MSAKVTTELELNVAPFLASVKKAIGVADDLPTSIEVEVSADTARAQGNLDKVGDAVKATPDKVDIEVTANTEKAQTSLGKLQESLKESVAQAKGGDIGGAFEGITGAVGAAFPQVAAIGAAVGAVGAAFSDTFNKGQEFNKALKAVSLQTGLTGEELDKLGSQAKEAFQQGVGESVADATKVLGTLKQTLGDALPTDQLADVAKRATAVGQALGV